MKRKKSKSEMKLKSFYLTRYSKYFYAVGRISEGKALRISHSAEGWVAFEHGAHVAFVCAETIHKATGIRLPKGALLKCRIQPIHLTYPTKDASDRR